jgi:hypothetical protein
MTAIHLHSFVEKRFNRDLLLNLVLKKNHYRYQGVVKRQLQNGVHKNVLIFSFYSFSENPGAHFILSAEERRNLY